MKTNKPPFFSGVVMRLHNSLLLKSLLLLMVVCTSSSTYAQRAQRERIDFKREKLEYQGFTIRPIPALGGSLGYDIYKGHKRVVHQYQNPVIGKKLNNKADVYKVAEWAIAQYSKTNRFPATVPPGALKELHLSNN